MLDYIDVNVVGVSLTSTSALDYDLFLQTPIEKSVFNNEAAPTLSLNNSTYRSSLKYELFPCDVRRTNHLLLSTADNGINSCSLEICQRFLNYSFVTDLTVGDAIIVRELNSAIILLEGQGNPDANNAEKGEVR